MPSATAHRFSSGHASTASSLFLRRLPGCVSSAYCQRSIMASSRVLEPDDRLFRQRLAETQQAGAPQTDAATVQIQHAFVLVADERAIGALIEQPERLPAADEARVMTRRKCPIEFEIAVARAA